MKPSLRIMPSANLVSLTLVSIALTIGSFEIGIPVLELTELRTYDLRLLSRGPVSPTPAVAIAAIDEKSLDVEGRWPWPRSTLARLVDALSAAGVRVIAFDVTFPEPDDSSGLVVIDELERTANEIGIDEPELVGAMASLRRRADHDRLLADSIQRSPAAVVLGYFFHRSPEGLEYEIPAAEIERGLQQIGRSAYEAVIFRDPDVGARKAIKAYAAEVNIEPLSDVADSAGYFTLIPDDDGLVRWMPLVIRSGGELFAPLAIQAAWHFLGEPQRMVRVDRYGGIDGVRLGPRLVPTDDRGRLLINYLGPPKTIPHYSVSDILAGEVAAEALRDRIVIVAATASGIYDSRSTPFATVFPGTEIHANVIDNLLTGDFIAKPDWLRWFDRLAIVLLATLVGIGLSRMHALQGLLFATALAVLYVVIARQLLVSSRLWLDIVHPLLGLGITYVVLTAYRYVMEERERTKVRDAFGRYVSGDVIEQMLADPSKLRLGGEERVLTVLFSDLEGFTAASEHHGPEQMIELLSDYYSRMTDHIFEHGGMLKEYVADELMAIFGAPVEIADHAQQACSAALRMLYHRRELSAEWVAMGRPALNARTGINSGRMLVGNIGSEYRLSYGVMGDEVNLASRLEGINKVYATQILIGENTAELVSSDFQLREIDEVRVIGREHPTRIFELLAAAGETLPDGLEGVCAAYAEGLAAYRKRDWEGAIRAFEQSLSMRDDDGPSRTMLKRCRVYRESPPPLDWEGVFEAPSK